MSVIPLDEPASLPLGWNFGAIAARLLPFHDKKSTAQVKSPFFVSERIVDGHRIFEPPPGVKPYFYLLYYHGYGGIGDEEVFLRELAAGKYGHAVTVIAPLAHELVPPSSAIENASTTINAVRFVMAHPGETRQQILKATAGNGKNIFENAGNLWSSTRKPKSWYALKFKEMREAGKTVLKPHYDGILDSIIKKGEPIVGHTRAVLDKLGAKPGEVGILTFSQGAGPGSVFTKCMPDGYVKAIVMVSGSYVETERSKRMKSLRIRNKRTYAETILPNGDNVHQMIGLEAARVLQDLRRAFHVREAFRKCAKVWTHVRGKHELKGEVASFAAERLMHLMRPEPARPKLAFSFASAARWTGQLTGLLNDA